MTKITVIIRVEDADGVNVCKKIASTNKDRDLYTTLGEMLCGVLDGVDCGAVIGTAFALDWALDSDPYIDSECQQEIKLQAAIKEYLAWLKNPLG